MMGTEDPALRAYADTDLSGNTLHTYRLITLLDGGGTIESAPTRASIFGLDESTVRAPATSPSSVPRIRATRSFRLTGRDDAITSGLRGGCRNGQAIWAQCARS